MPVERQTDFLLNSTLQTDARIGLEYARVSHKFARRQAFQSINDIQDEKEIIIENGSTPYVYNPFETDLVSSDSV